MIFSTIQHKTNGSTQDLKADFTLVSKLKID